MSGGYLVICPKCGAIRNRANKVDASLICKECGHPFYLYMDGEFRVGLPKQWTEDQRRMKTVKAFVTSLKQEASQKTKARIRYPELPRLCTTHCVAEGRTHYLATPAKVNGKPALTYRKNGEIDSYITMEEINQAVYGADVPEVILDF